MHCSLRRPGLSTVLPTALAGLLFCATGAALEADSVDAEDTATSIDLGGFVGFADNAPVRSIFDLLSVGTLISGVQSDENDSMNRIIARDTPVPVGGRTDAPDFNLNSAAYRFGLPDKFALTVHAENNKYGQQTYLYSPVYETYGVDTARPERTDARLTLSHGDEIRPFVGVSYNALNSPLSRSQIGLGGLREGRGRFRQRLSGVEGGLGWYPEFLNGLFQAYLKGTVGSSAGATRFHLLTVGHSQDPRTAEERANDPRVFLETDYLEFVSGKIQIQSLYTIAEAGGLYRFGGRFAVRLGVFLQAFTYAIPGTEGHMYFKPQSGEEVFTPLQVIPSNVFRNLDTVRGISFSFLVKI